MRLVAAAVICVFAWVSQANAWVQNRTDSGARVHWATPSIPMYVNVNSCRDVSPEDVATAVVASAKTWEEATRPGDSAPCADVNFVLRTTDATDTAAYTHRTRKDDGVNRVVWHHEAWHDRSSTFALTKVFFDVPTGEILETDMDINAVNYHWGTAPGDADIQNTLTHEFGHILGFSHSPSEDSAMYANSYPGDVRKRNLSPDDIDGVCTVYPLGSLGMEIVEADAGASEDAGTGSDASVPHDAGAVLDANSSADAGSHPGSIHGGCSVSHVHLKTNRSGSRFIEVVLALVLVQWSRRRYIHA